MTRGRTLWLVLVRLVRQPWRLVIVVCAGTALALMDEYVVEPGGIPELLLKNPADVVAGVVMWAAIVGTGHSRPLSETPETESANPVSD